MTKEDALNLISDSHGAAHVLRVRGEIDLATAPGLEEALAPAGAQPSCLVVVDLTQCSFIDSSGLRSLLRAQERLRRAGSIVAVAGLQPNVRKVFELTGVAGAFRIHSSARTALRSMRREPGLSNELVARPAEPA
jgi:anti-anti-sigma factor